MSTTSDIGSHGPRPAFPWMVAEKGKPPILRRGTRRAIVAFTVIAISLILVWTIEYEVTQPMTEYKAGGLTPGYYGLRNTSFGMYIDRPGVLTGAWETNIYLNVPAYEPILYQSSDCVLGNPDPFNVSCHGTPVWSGPMSLSPGWFNVSLTPGSYTMVFVSANASIGAWIAITQPFVLYPTAWWWA